MSKYLRYGFYIIGTFLLFFSSIVVVANFCRDSGAFDKSEIEVKKQKPVVQAEVSTSTTPKKIYVENDSEPEPAKKTPAKVTQKPKRVLNNKKLIVEVLNSTKKDGLAENIRQMIQAKGHSASAGNIVSKQGTSQIIIRNKGANVSEISRMLRIFVIKEDFQADPKVDVTIIIGRDFNP